MSPQQQKPRNSNWDVPQGYGMNFNGGYPQNGQQYSGAPGTPIAGPTGPARQPNMQPHPPRMDQSRMMGNIGQFGMMQHPMMNGMGQPQPFAPKPMMPQMQQPRQGRMQSMGWDPLAVHRGSYR